MNIKSGIAWLSALLLTSIQCYAEEEFTFDASEFEKKPFEFGGYGELLYEHFELNQDSATYLLFFPEQSDRDQLDRITGAIELFGNYSKNKFGAKFTLHGEAKHDQLDNDSFLRLYQGLISYKPTPQATLELGKKATKWGKGYAWNPVGFIERRKDPNDPNLSREGYVVAAADLIYSQDSALKTIAFTPVLLPVTSNINDTYGKPDHNNLAMKLYLLFYDTDIDFLSLSNGSRSARYGVDFSRNITTNFEIHGEWAYISETTKPVFDSEGNVDTVTDSANNYLVGLRYLTENETTWITEYYHNGSGYSKNELETFYELVHDAKITADNPLIGQLKTIGKQGYVIPNPGQNYLYIRAANKEPFDFLYFVPALTSIINLDDHSYSLTAEATYSGWTSLELRGRLSFLQGDPLTEFGEKQNQTKFELRLRYYY